MTLKHSYIANGLGGKDGSVIIDLSSFRQISVDPQTYIATIGPGNRLGDIALGLNNAGRAIPHGTCPYVGVGGHFGKQINQFLFKKRSIFYFILTFYFFQ